MAPILQMKNLRPREAASLASSFLKLESAKAGLRASPELSASHRLRLFNYLPLEDLVYFLQMQVSIAKPYFLSSWQ